VKRRRRIGRARGTGEKRWKVEKKGEVPALMKHLKRQKEKGMKTNSDAGRPMKEKRNDGGGRRANMSRAHTHGRRVRSKEGTIRWGAPTKELKTTVCGMASRVKKKKGKRPFHRDSREKGYKRK